MSGKGLAAAGSFASGAGGSFPAAMLGWLVR